MPGRLQDRIALITGASSGIGRATAFAYAAEGAKLVCADLNEGTWRETAPNDESNGPTHQRIKDSGGSAIYVHCDVTDPSSVEAAVAAAVKEYGRLDVMINNAGFALEARAPAPVWETDIDIFKKTQSVNVNGVFYGIKYASAQMIKQDPLPNGDRGWILNAASIFGLVGVETSSAYCTSKGAVANLTRAAAIDCAPHRIHVNAVNPGYVATHMTDGIFAEAAVKEGVAAMHPFRGIGRPEDIAKVYVFLASDDASWISGVNLPVDGGYTAR
ncbi:related to dehydrogenases with different specificities (related to short-chain alcohol dehydrogenases) [Ramularia collo-cygni]|uniref:Related to dehydrogenases with different specificities (Related to short-chain alcohol dehydrogenases) n=1 Tax=Ramularia collo-cygni TaxID=112498 RepID=A0A2D3VBW7_9PEZI|nr:related to dehydrogenases with different specificities (related to short-chain alcohol dehydrogenases) [Ramularia collo-cygni]CZT19099.1 related to dehydrogenases with different specificities (related to short-chain alcohol dehydrogenases) [Ramularia collo-cygni]